ncbi:hypothetical protein Mapa_006888 [Marchantia paleacea]|nr:hypothetical protein Mapa_006888 [Marchantia paleacea]
MSVNDTPILSCCSTTPHSPPPPRLLAHSHGRAKLPACLPACLPATDRRHASSRRSVAFGCCCCQCSDIMSLLNLLPLQGSPLFQPNPVQCRDPHFCCSHQTNIQQTAALIFFLMNPPLPPSDSLPFLPSLPLATQTETE